LEKARDELQGHQAVAARDFSKGLELLKKAGGVDAGYLARVQLQAGKADEALKAARSQVNSHAKEVIPLAQLVDLLWEAGKKEEAKKEFEKLREISGSIDLQVASPLFARLEPVLKELNLPSDWRIVKPAKDDVGVRPPLDSLGPLRWQPSPAIQWTLKDAAGAERSMTDYSGQPVVVIFFLGNGCLHCAEQLHAFGKAAADFEKEGLALVAISSDDQAGLKQSIANYNGGPIPIPLLSDDTLSTFKAYRCYDDFEQQPLHGTFLIDGDGKVRWQDISYEPFMDPKFVITESQRLLGASAAAHVAAAPTDPSPTPASGSE
jgi:peroxiredoxin